ILTCEQWVAWKTGLSPARARDIVQLATRREALPATFRSLDDGELSVDQATVVARHTPPEYDEDVAALARLATVSQLRRSLRRYEFGPPAAAPPVVEPDPCFLTGWFDDRGRYRLRALLDADEGAIVDAALREARDALFHEHDEPATGPEALVEVARRSLAAVPSSARRETFNAIFHVPLGAAFWHLGPALPPRLRRQLLCDASGVVVGVRCGRTVSLGRSSRIVPVWLRRVIEDRDHGCRVPGCTSRRVQIHHIRHWEDGGATEPANLVALCPRHHRLHHRGLLDIVGDADRPRELSFTDRFGRTMAGAHPPPHPHADRAVVVSGTWRHPLGERLQTKWLHFEPRPPPLATDGGTYPLRQ
ncbi:MAG TPA: DUF222 domain-containing protein, partial [Acidimicrobiales bacterium]